MFREGQRKAKTEFPRYKKKGAVNGTVKGKKKKKPGSNAPWSVKKRV